MWDCKQPKLGSLCSARAQKSSTLVNRVRGTGSGADAAAAAADAVPRGHPQKVASDARWRKGFQSYTGAT